MILIHNRIDLVVDSLRVERLGVLTVSGKGYANATGPATALDCTGGGNGGRGGGNSTTITTIDDVYNPTVFGSASGLCYGRVNGTGGGSLHIVARDLNVVGTISADGVSAGSGGSLWVQCFNCLGNGTLSAAGSHNSQGNHLILVVT